MAPFIKNFNFNFRRDPQKNYHEHRDYESVDEKSLKNDEKEFDRYRVKEFLYLLSTSNSFKKY